MAPRTLLLFMPYTFAVWVTAYRGLHGDDAAGLACVLLLLGGAALLVNLAFFRRTIQPLVFSTAAAGALALMGLSLGTVSAGESGVGVVAGLVVGGVAAVAVVLAARRRRRRVRTIFLSYRRADSGDIVPGIRERLAERFGPENVFWDLDSMELGGRFRDIIADAVNHADALIAIIGDRWLSLRDEAGSRRIDDPDDLVRIEIETALQNRRVLVVPLAVKGAGIPQSSDLPQSLRDLVSRSGGVVGSSAADFETDMSRLVRGLDHGAVTPWSRAAPTPVRWSWVAVMTAMVVLPPAGLLLEVPAADYRSVNDAAWRPGMPMLATAHGVGIGVRSRVRLWDTTTGVTLHTIDLDDGPVWSVAWSADGTRLAYGDHDGTLVVLEADSWAEQRRFEQHAGMLQEVAWAPRGDFVASGDDRGVLHVWSAASGLQFATPTHTSHIERTRWSPDGSRLATASWDRTVAVTDAVTGDVVHRFEGHTSYVQDVAWAPDGARLASGSLEPPYAVLWSADATRPGVQLAGVTAPVGALAWSPDGAWLAGASRDRAVVVWNASGEFTTALDVGGSGVSGVAWSPDGTRVVASGDREVSIFEAGRWTLLRRWVAHEDDYAVAIVGWSPDGRQFATRGAADDAVKVWDAATGRLLTTARVTLMRGLLDRFF